MGYLLDTHALIWYTDDPAMLSEQARAFIDNSTGPYYVSAASLWEIVMKYSIGKLELLFPLSVFFSIIRNTGFTDLPITDIHLTQLSLLPHHHRDPFDRLLIAQAIAEDFTFISKDAVMQQYPVKLLW